MPQTALAKVEKDGVLAFLNLRIRHLNLIAKLSDELAETERKLAEEKTRADTLLVSYTMAQNELDQLRACEAQGK